MQVYRMLQRHKLHNVTKTQCHKRHNVSTSMSQPRNRHKRHKCLRCHTLIYRSFDQSAQDNNLVLIQRWIQIIARKREPNSIKLPLFSAMIRLLVCNVYVHYYFFLFTMHSSLIQ